MSELAPGLPAVQVMSEYVRAVRLLGHPTPEPTRLHAAYTAEDGMDLQALDADARALSVAAATAEETLLLQDQVRRALDGAWRGVGAQAAVEELRRHAMAAAGVVDGLRGAAVALDELRNRLRQLVDDKLEATLEVEARGTRTEWLGAARTVTTGAGDRAAASELVDQRVAPFVAHDIGVDWVSSMRDTEDAIRRAYREAAAGTVAATFDHPGPFTPPRAEPAAAERVWAPPPAPAAMTAPAAYIPAPPAPDPAAGPAPAEAAPPTMPAPVMPAAAPAAAPASVDPGVLSGGAVSPLGSGMSGMSGLSGLGQSFADLLGGLLGTGGAALGDSVGGTDGLDLGPDDDPEDLEIDGPTGDAETGDDVAEDDVAEDDVADDEKPGDEEPGDEAPDDEEPEDEEPGDDRVEPGDDVSAESAESDAPVAPIEPVVPQPEPPAPPPVPDPPADPVVVPVEPAPPQTPCEIAADELPQAGP
ncbi:hypothetical protein V4U86_22320 [Mycobacterium sp. AMU20-3851]|uniref:hypothetical protein n=1 Tax=Mycobacterium sp. AMU20-3851 TaxID=3122055 RepID=UPI0037549D34